MLFAGEWTQLWSNPNRRFFLRLLAAHVVLAVVLIPAFVLSDPGDLPWSAYIGFGLAWLAFVVLAAARVLYQVAWGTRAAVRWGIIVGGGWGLGGGGVVAFAETGFVAGFPPIVLFFTPFMVFGATFAGGMLGWLAGLAANGFARLLVR